MEILRYEVKNIGVARVMHQGGMGQGDSKHHDIKLSNVWTMCSIIYLMIKHFDFVCIPPTCFLLYVLIIYIL